MNHEALLKKISDLKEKMTNAATKEAALKGKREALMQQLIDQFGIETLEDAAEKLDDLSQSIDSIDASLSELSGQMDDLVEEWGEYEQ